VAVKFTHDRAAAMPEDHHACMNSTGLALAFESTPTNSSAPNGTMPDGHMDHTHSPSSTAKPGAASRPGAWSTGGLLVLAAAFAVLMS
jgi:hypothetical protein